MLPKWMLFLPMLVTEGFLVGSLFSMLLLKISGDPTVPMFGTTMALLGFLLYPFLYGREFTTNWTLAGSMGIPRKTFLSYCLLRQLVLTAVSGILLLCLTLLEAELSGWLGLRKPLGISWLIHAGPALCLTFTMLQLLLGILYNRFHNGIYWSFFAGILLIPSEWGQHWAVYRNAILAGAAGLVILAGICCLWYGSRKLAVK